VTKLRAFKAFTRLQSEHGYFYLWPHSDPTIRVGHVEVNHSHYCIRYGRNSVEGYSIHRYLVEVDAILATQPNVVQVWDLDRNVDCTDERRIFLKLRGT